MAPLKSGARRRRTPANPSRSAPGGWGVRSRSADVHMCVVVHRRPFRSGRESPPDENVAAWRGWPSRWLIWERRWRGWCFPIGAPAVVPARPGRYVPGAWPGWLGRPGSAGPHRCRPAYQFRSLLPTTPGRSSPRSSSTRSTAAPGWLAHWAVHSGAPCVVPSSMLRPGPARIRTARLGPDVSGDRGRPEPARPGGRRS